MVIPFLVSAIRKWDGYVAHEGRHMATRFILCLRLSTQHHYALKPLPCLKRVEPL